MFDKRVLANSSWLGLGKLIPLRLTAVTLAPAAAKPKRAAVESNPPDHGTTTFLPLYFLRLPLSEIEGEYLGYHYKKRDSSNNQQRKCI